MLADSTIEKKRIAPGVMVMVLGRGLLLSLCMRKKNIKDIDHKINSINR